MMTNSNLTFSLSSVSYMCCMTGSLGIACMMHTAHKHPNLSSKTLNCHTDLHTEKHPRSTLSYYDISCFQSHSLEHNLSKQDPGRLIITH